MMKKYYTILITIIPLFLTANIKKNTLFPQLVDVTRQAGIDFHHSIGDDKLSNIVESTGAGVCVFDYNGDGKPDIYFVNGTYLKGISHIKGRRLKGKLKNRLFKNNGNGTFSDVTDQSGVGNKGYGMGAVAADYDNDGDTDLFVTNFGSNAFYRNNGNGTFSEVSTQIGLSSPEWSTGATFLDFDRDGYLDLYIGNYLRFDPNYRNYFAAEAFPGPLAYAGVRDQLFRNLGNGNFKEISQTSGIASLEGRAMGVAAADLDGDGHIDIYVANDGMENYLFKNNGNSTFSESALLTGVQFGQNGEATSAMGPEFGDFNQDGRIDILVPDMGYSCLYKNSGNGYIEASAMTGIAPACGQYTSWSGNFFDFDSDGHLDIFIANGDSHHLEAEEDLLFRNVGGKFQDISNQVGPSFRDKFVSRGSALLDFDNDGDLDIIELNLNGPARLLENRKGPKVTPNNWIKIQLKGKKQLDAIGSVVTVLTGKQKQTRYMVSSSGYLSQSQGILHFGLGKVDRIEQIQVRWPNGKSAEWKDPKMNQTIILEEK